MTTKHFLNLRDLPNQDILNILDRAIERKSQKQKEKTLIGSKLGLIFEKPSTRTVSNTHLTLPTMLPV